MKSENIDAAFGLVKDGFEAITHEPVRHSHSPIKRYIMLTLAALVLLAVILPPALTAAGSELIAEGSWRVTVPTD